MSRHLLRPRLKQAIHRCARQGPAWQHNGTWTISGSYMTNTPTLGSELLSNVEFTTNTTGWAAGSGATLTRRDFSSSPNIAPTGGIDNFGLEVASGGSSSSNGSQSATTVTGTWYQVQSLAYSPSANTGVNSATNTYTGAFSAISSVTTTSEDNWQSIINIILGTSTTGGIQLRTNSATSGDKAYFDAPSIKALTLNRLMAVRSGLANPSTVSAQGSIGTRGCPAGIIYGLDSISSPTTFLLGIHANRSLAQLYKCVSGTWTQLISSSTSYVVGVLPEIRYIGSNKYQLWYNGTQRGSDQTVTDAGTGTLHGVFSASPTNYINGFVMS